MRRLQLLSVQRWNSCRVRLIRILVRDVRSWMATGNVCVASRCGSAISTTTRMGPRIHRATHAATTSRRVRIRRSQLIGILILILLVDDRWVRIVLLLVRRMLLILVRLLLLKIRVLMWRDLLLNLVVLRLLLLSKILLGQRIRIDVHLLRIVTLRQLRLIGASIRIHELSLTIIDVQTVQRHRIVVEIVTELLRLLIRVRLRGLTGRLLLIRRRRLRLILPLLIRKIVLAKLLLLLAILSRLRIVLRRVNRALHVHLQAAWQSLRVLALRLIAMAGAATGASLLRLELQCLQLARHLVAFLQALLQ